MDYPVHFAGQLRQHLRSLRQAKGLTQARLAQLVGLSQPRIAELEANPSTVSVSLLFRVLAALDAQVLLRSKAGVEARVSTAGSEAAVQGAKAKTADPAEPGDSW